MQINEGFLNLCIIKKYLEICDIEDINVGESNKFDKESPTTMQHEKLFDDFIISSPISPSIPRMEGNRLIYDCDPLINSIKGILNRVSNSLKNDPLLNL